MIWADTTEVHNGKAVRGVHQHNISLQGDSYVYVCQACQNSITEFMYEQAQQLPNRLEERCPMCRAKKSLRYVRLGEKMRFHFRVDIKVDPQLGQLAGGAGWYGEVAE